MPPIAAQTPCKNHRLRKKPRRSDPTSSPPSLSDGGLPQKALQSQSLNRAKTPYPGYLVQRHGVIIFFNDIPEAFNRLQDVLLVTSAQGLAQ
jgi:hypothetical protein